MADTVNINITVNIDISDWVYDYGDDLFRYAFSKIRKKEVAEDLVQDTFVVAHTKIHSFEGNSSVKTWLIAILKNKIADYYRKQIKENLTDKELDVNVSSFDVNGGWKEDKKPFSFEDTSHLLDNELFVKVFYDCIDALPKLWSGVVRLKYINPTKSKEICKELNISESNLWQIVHRSKLKLKDCLDVNWIKKGY